MDFIIPLHLQDLELDVSDRYTIQTTFDYSDPSHLLQTLNDLKMKINIEFYTHDDNCHFDQLYSIVRRWDTIDEKAQELVMQILVSSLDLLVDVIMSGEMEDNMDMVKKGVKMSTVLLCAVLVNGHEKYMKEMNDVLRKKTKKKEDKKNQWPGLCEMGLHALLNSLNESALTMWSLRLPEEALLGLHLKTVFEICENSLLMRIKSLRTVLNQIITNIVVNMSSSVTNITSSLFHLTNKHEHYANHCAELLHTIAIDHNDQRLVVEFLCEIGRLKNYDASKDTTGTKNVSIFLAQLSRLIPKIVLSNISILLPLLDANAYMLRNAIVTTIVQIILYEHTKTTTSSLESDPSRFKTRDTLLNVLHDRIHDINAFARAAVLKGWIDLVEARAVPLSHMHTVASAGMDRLVDRTVNVRKAAVQLLSTLLEYNPYASNLSKAPFVVKLKELEAIDESDVAENWSEEETQVHEKKIAFYTSTLEFIVQMEKALTMTTSFLNSNSPTDVLVAITFLVQGYQFHVDGSLVGLQKTLVLIWRSGEENIIAALCKTFTEVLFSACSDTKVYVQRLEMLLQGMTIAQSTSLEKLLQTMQEQKQLPSGLLLALWQSLEKDVGRRHDILHLLGMFQTSLEDHPARLTLLLQAGLGENVLANEDWKMVQRMCLVVRNGMVGSSTDVAIVRLSDAAVLRLCDFLILNRKCIDKNRPNWFPAAEQAVKCIFKLSSRPLDECTELLETLTANVFSKSATSFDLSRWLFLVGQVAVESLVFVESLASSIKSKSNSAESNDTLEKELGMSAEKDANYEALVHELTQNEIVGETTVLGTYGTIVAQIARNENDTYIDPKIHLTSTLSLCKLMCVSQTFAEKHLPLLFTILRRTKKASIRGNIMIALGDLAVRFPNLIEPWTSHLYAPLRDTDVSVRKTTLMVLTHLILNDMVKVKGQVAEIIMLLKDENMGVRELTKVFFIELSKRGNNPVYNLLPDTISQLSQRDNLSTSDFRDLVKFLLSFITKDKHIESLVEKLCGRFSKTDEVRQWNYIAYCLATLPFTSEKVIKKFLDLSKSFRHVMSEPTVSEHIDAIIVKARKSAKPDVMILIEEFEKEHERVAEKTDENTKPKKKKKNETTTKKGKPQTTRVQKVVDDSESESEESSDGDSDSDLSDTLHGSEVISA